MRKKNNLMMAHEINEKLKIFETKYDLPGLSNPGARECFLYQIVDSIRRVKYIDAINLRELNQECADPMDLGFNPIKAAAWNYQNGNINEAFWLVFLITIFGKNKRTGWSLLKAVYSNLGNGPVRDWEKSSSFPEEMIQWMEDNQLVLLSIGKFGNHRKYENLRSTGSGAAILSYIEWVGADLDHVENIRQIIEDSQNTPRSNFDKLYKSLNIVYRFGRMAKFDYLTMVGKLKLIEIEPGSVYMQGATGPYQGACLLFTGNDANKLSRGDVNDLLAEMDDHFKFEFGMQVLEDALCNWHKSPEVYLYFNG